MAQLWLDPIFHLSPILKRGPIEVPIFSGQRGVNPGKWRGTYLRIWGRMQRSRRELLFPKLFLHQETGRFLESPPLHWKSQSITGVSFPTDTSAESHNCHQMVPKYSKGWTYLSHIQPSTEVFQNSGSPCYASCHSIHKSTFGPSLLWLVGIL